MHRNLLRAIQYFKDKNTLKVLKRNKIYIYGKLSDHVNTLFCGNNVIRKGAYITDSVVGRGTYIGENTILDRTQIGSFCSISYGVKLVSGEHPTSDFVSSHPAFYSTKMQAGFTYVSEDLFKEYKFADGEDKYYLIIGNDVCIGAYTILRGGIKIGDGAIIAAGSVVVKDVEPYSVVGGNPAKLLKYRFDKSQIDELLNTKWWNWDDEKIKSNLSFFTKSHNS